ncbi:MAG: thiopurine S-methyltransferase [Pseudomonadota bacterium]
MDAAFWHDRWQRGAIGFHEPEPNGLLTTHFPQLLRLMVGGTPSRVFLPLCGKTRDIPWLLSQGCRVVGVELSELAVRELFEALSVQPEVATVDRLKCYSAEGVDVFVGDLFDLSAAQLGDVAGIYDRAALIALPQEMRARYAEHVQRITHNAPQLLIVLVYDQRAMDGPPFSLSDDEVSAHYEAGYTVELLESRRVPGGLKGECAADEKAWLLARR